MLTRPDELSVKFLLRILPATGHYVMQYKKRTGGWSNPTFASTVEELWELIERYCREGLDTYHACASYKVARTNPRKMHPAYAALWPKEKINTLRIYGRTKANVHSVKAFFRDIDIGPSKHYKTQDEATKAVIEFCDKYKLPLPIFVSSGNGLHIYWALTEEIDPVTWEKYNDGLIHLCKESNLRCERVDITSVLRTPGTVNYKNRKNPLAVEIDPKFLDHPPCTLDRFAAFAEASARAAPRRTDKEVTKLKQFIDAAAIPSDYPPSYAHKIAEHCPQLQRMRDTRGVMSEPDWKNCLDLLKYCVDGEALARDWSEGDDRFDAAEALGKMERAPGPTTCKKFHDTNASICEQCKHWGTKLNSPITLGVILPGQLQAEVEHEGKAKTATDDGAATKGGNETKTAAESGAAAEDEADAETATEDEDENGHKYKELEDLIKQLQKDVRRTLQFEFTKTGYKQHSYINARSGLIILQSKCSYDVFHDRKFMGGELLSDEMVHALRDRMTRLFKVDFGEAAVFAALQLLCETNKYDPVVDELKLYQAQWDHVPRLNRGAIAYLGSPDTPLNSAIFRKSMIALVRRARHPGCKFDYLPILEGLQGNLKSTFLRVLAGSDANFSDQPLLHKDDKAQQELMAGVWVYEIGELVGLRKTEVEALKGFLSRTYDRARPAYGRIRLDQPRRGVPFGTTNEIKYLRDLTGNRRIWPLTTGVIDIPTFERDRTQVLGEAAYHEAQGESLMLPQNLWEAAAEAQEARMEKHHWEDLLADVQGEEIVSDGKGGWEERVSTQTLIRTFLQLPSGYYNVDTRRIAAIMRKNGWQDDRMKFKAAPTLGDPSGTRTVTKNGYWRPAKEPPGGQGEDAKTSYSPEDVSSRLDAVSKLFRN
jgi:predicted P-loop ATPase